MSTFETKNVCARKIDFSIRDGRVHDVKFFGGCAGNAKAVSALIEGMPIDEAIKRIKGITCGGKGTSCGDQLAIALEQYKAEIASN